MISDPAFHLQSADTIRNLLLEFLFFDISLTLGRKRKLAKVREMQVRTMIRYHSSFKPAGTDWEPVDLTVYASRNAFGFAVALLRSIKQNWYSARKQPTFLTFFQVGLGFSALANSFHTSVNTCLPDSQLLFRIANPSYLPWSCLWRVHSQIN